LCRIGASAHQHITEISETVKKNKCKQTRAFILGKTNNLKKGAKLLHKIMGMDVNSLQQLRV
jgi:hypothetical protein